MELSEGREGQLLGTRDCSGSAGGKVQGGTPALEGYLSTSGFPFPAANSLFVHLIPAQEPEVPGALNFLLQREENGSGEDFPCPAGSGLLPTSLPLPQSHPLHLQDVKCSKLSAELITPGCCSERG